MSENTGYQQLRSIYQTFKLKTDLVGTPSSEKPFLVRFNIANKSWVIYIEDEYGDFDLNNQLLSVFLVLRALEDYDESEDYLFWCKQYGLNASDEKWQEYYDQLLEIYREIKKVLGSIDSYINPMDYQLRSGDYDQLLKGE